VVLLHGYMLPALPTWADTGIAERLAAAGNRVVMPDRRSLAAPDLKDNLARFRRRRSQLGRA
jgi:hypothetical protein